MSLPGSSLDILSAASFPDTLPQDSFPASGQGPPPALYGGILISDGLSTSDTNIQPLNEVNGVNGAQKTRKNSQPKRKSKGNGFQVARDTVGGGSKKRGRPRLNTADETASERRRTQIRLAQRAYRLRKETAISSLHERVAELEKTVEEMSKTFLDLNDQVMNSCLLSSQPELTRQFRGATRRFLSLAKSASHGLADGEDSSEPTEKHDSSQGPQSQQNSSESSQTQSTFTQSPAVLEGLNAATLAPSRATQSLLDLTVASWAFPSPEMDQSLFADPFAADASGSNIPRAPDVPWPHDLLAAYTYSFQETTFSRRLHRRCLELGYAALSNPNFSPILLQEKFRFSFNISTRSRLASSFHFLLQRKAGEPLEFWNRPYYSIGNAGMHYPRRDEDGNEIYPPNMHPPEKAFGPWPLHQSETRHSYTTIDEIIEAAGFGGQWFDCHDVEGYLNSKGIFLDSSSSYVEVPPSVIGAADSDHSTPLSMGMESRLNIASNIPLAPSFYSTQNQTGAHALGLLGIYGGNPVAKSLFDGRGGSSDSGLPTRFPVLDVDTFMNNLVYKAVCLGRAPGFRQRDVDRALLSSTSIPSDSSSGISYF